jgi:hypothetical protein
MCNAVRLARLFSVKLDSPGEAIIFFENGGSRRDMVVEPIEDPQMSSKILMNTIAVIADLLMRRVCCEKRREGEEERWIEIRNHFRKNRC